MSYRISYTPIKTVAKYKTIRILNLIGCGFLFKNKSPKKKRDRSGAQPRYSQWLFTVFFGGLILSSIAFQSYTLIQKVSSGLGQTEVLADKTLIYPARNCVTDGILVYDSGFNCIKNKLSKNLLVSEEVQNAIGLELVFIFLAMLFVGIVVTQLSKHELEMEWFYNLPIPISNIFCIKFLERSIFNPMVWLVIWPFLSLFALQTESASSLGGAIFQGFLGAIFLSLLLAVSLTFISSGVRIVIAPNKILYFQAISSFIATGFVFLSLFILFMEKPIWIDLNFQQLNWVSWTPVGLIVKMMSTKNVHLIGLYLIIALAQISLFTAITILILKSLLKKGIVINGERFAQRKTPTLSKSLPDILSPKSQSIKLNPTKSTYISNLLTPIQKKEVIHLFRDVRFLMRVLLIPLGLMVAYFSIDIFSDFISWFFENYSRIAMGGFIVSNYALFCSSFTVIDREGSSLWLLYTFPRSFESLIKQKIRFWTCAYLVHPIAFFTYKMATSGLPTMGELVTMFTSFFGIVVFGSIAGSLGILSGSCQDGNADTKSKFHLVTLFILLSIFYCLVFFTNNYFNIIVIMALLVLLSLSLWEKARDSIYYIFDAPSNQPSKPALADGLFALIFFFFLQHVLSYCLFFLTFDLSPARMIFANAMAIAIVFLGLRLIQKIEKTKPLPQFLSPSIMEAVGWGLFLGSLSALIGYLCLKFIPGFGVSSLAVMNLDFDMTETRSWLILAALFIGPVFKEYIFRGIIFQALNTSYGLIIGTVISALVFSLLQPQSSIPSGMFLGVVTALGYAKSRQLLTPILIHYCYIFIVSG